MREGASVSDWAVKELDFNIGNTIVNTLIVLESVSPLPRLVICTCDLVAGENISPACIRCDEKNLKL